MSKEIRLTVNRFFKPEEEMKTIIIILWDETEQ